MFKITESIKKFIINDIEKDIDKFKEHSLNEINTIKSSLTDFTKNIINEINRAMEINLNRFDARLKVIESKFELKKEELKENIDV
jgi:hypothetical protein